MLILLRAAAVAIAIAAVIDPALTSARSSRPAIVVVAGAPRHEQLADQVARELDDDYMVLRSPFSGAAAIVIAGDALPPAAADMDVPSFIVDPASRPRLRAVRAPAHAQRDSHVPVDVMLQPTADDAPVVVTLHANGAIADQQSVQIGAAPVIVTLSFVPVSVGPAALRVQAGAESADVVVDITDQKRRILFFDSRPSWMSTFARRAAERDPRLDVTTRVITSRSISSATRAAPAGMTSGLDGFDVIVAGAPEDLTAGEVTALDAWLRRTGANLLLLPDHPAHGPYERLPGAAWQPARVPSPIAVTLAGDGATLRATELLRPLPGPVHIETVALDSTGRPVVWRAAVGAGKLWFSGAADSWRFRDPGLSRFDRFWQTLIATAAAGAIAPVSVDVQPAALRPGEMFDVDVTVRDAALAGYLADSPARASVAGTVAGQSLRFWPTGAPGSFRATARAPRTAGTYSVAVNAGSSSGSAGIVVSADAERANALPARALVEWTASRHGAVIPATQLNRLSDAISLAAGREEAQATWYPMRSPWWIVPFTLLLGIEWWMRRRRGLA
jgi:hypothetical protein